MTNLVLSTPPSIAAIPRGYVYLPSIKAHTLPIAPVGEPLPVEKQIYLKMALHPYQARKGMVWHSTLAAIAYTKCKIQAMNEWTGHVDPDGFGPNYYCRKFGYQLPSWYGQEWDANNVESLAHNGGGKPDEVWAAWMNSEGHRTHLLGLNDFYSGQTNVGVGYYYLESSPKKHYWCVLTAHPEEI